MLEDNGLGRARTGPLVISLLLLHRLNLGNIGGWMGLMDGATEEVADDDMVYSPLSVSLRLRLFMNGWSMTCLKLGLSFGFFLNSRWIRSLASFDMAAGN